MGEGSSDWRTRLIYFYTQNGSDSVFAKCAYCSICLKQQHLHPFLPGKPCCVPNLFVLIPCSFYFPHLVPVFGIYLLIYTHKFAVAVASKGVNHWNSGLQAPDFFLGQNSKFMQSCLIKTDYLHSSFYEEKNPITSLLGITFSVHVGAKTCLKYYSLCCCSKHISFVKMEVNCRMDTNGLLYLGDFHTHGCHHITVHYSASRICQKRRIMLGPTKQKTWFLTKM